jgi:hypothetical protein
MSAELSSMTLAEAEAWRAGWRAAQDAAASRLAGRSSNFLERGLYPFAELMRGVGTEIRAMEPPA